MRLWSIHPRYLDRMGIVALWREGLLAKKVLEGKTKGYKNHPQLERFKNYKDPLKAIESFLYFVYLEAKKRGYSFDKDKIKSNGIIERKIKVTKGQIEYEFKHLCKKLKKRDKENFEKLCKKRKNKILTNPLFYTVDGGVESWEKISS